jgi:putative colanic acid biosynthesis acetyltransferase WcaF
MHGFATVRNQQTQGLAIVLDSSDEIPVISLADAPGARDAWDRSRAVIYLWAICELLFVTNAWQISTRLRVRILRMFGAEIGAGVIMRPRVRVRFPWKLHIGNDCWIGEGVWFHNQDHIYIGHDCVISQETLLTTGSHAHRRDMALITRPITIRSGAWITSRCTVLGGATIGQSALVQPMSLISGTVPAGEIWGGNPLTFVKRRFEEDRTDE